MSDQISNPGTANDEVLSRGKEAQTVTMDKFAVLVDAGDRDRLMVFMEEMHPADLADILECLPRGAFEDAVRLLGNDLPADAIAELSEDLRIDALEFLPDQAVVEALEDLDSDDAALLAADLEDERQERVFEKVNAADRAAIQKSLDFDEETAGRLMQRDFVAAPDFWNVGQAIDHMRSAEDLPDPFYEIYLVDPAFRLTGAVPLSVLIRADREQSLASLRVELSSSVNPDMDQEEVAYLFQQYNLASSPVVDEAGRLTGMITIDDMVDVIQEENKEDLLALSGVNEGGVHQPVWDAVGARAPWLFVNLFTAFLASGVISMFEGTLSQIIALAVLMPVVAALGGNAGSQALAVTVRAIAEREMVGPSVRRAIWREFFAALINGVIFGVGVAAIALIWFRDPALASVIGIAMFCTFVWAGLSGVLVPLALKRLGADPAVSSSVFVLTSVDIIGFTAFLGLASLILIN